MDKNYDMQGARAALEKLSAGGGDVDDRQLADLTKTVNWSDQIDIECVEQPQTWRLLKTGSDNTAEEMVFTLAGIMCAKDLPPLLEKPSISSSRYKYLRQSLTITGLGSPTFGEAIKSAHEVFDIFQRQFAEDQVESWHSPTYSGHHSLNLSNRYLTPKRDAQDMVHLPFTDTVDPQGILEDMAKSNYIHGEDNKVSYFKCQIDQEGNRSFLMAKPQMFRVGDIVETQLSFVVVPLKGKTFKMMTILCSIVLLDSAFSQDAQRKRSLQEFVHTKLTLKRRVGYEITSEKGEKRVHMDVDDV